MNDSLRCLRAELDLAVRLAGSVHQRDAVRATAEALRRLVPQGGVVVAEEGGESPIVEAAGPLAAAAFSLFRHPDSLVIGGIHYAIASAVGSSSVRCSLVVVLGRAGGEAAPLDASVGRIARCLSGALGRMREEESGETDLRDRDLLVRELRHRTRNSLQMLKGSVLFLIQNSLERLPPEVLEALDERLCALVSLQELLNWSGDAEKVSAAAYFDRLGRELERLASPMAGSLAVRFEVGEGAFLPIDRATTIGLIVNELVTNSVKHGRDGALTMVLQVRVIGDLLLLRYTDRPESEEPVWEAREPAPRGGSGMELIGALISRARGRRIDGGNSPHNFVAAFPMV